MDQIKQLRIYPPEKGECKVIVVYEISEREELSQNGHYLSVDLGLHNLMTCYDSGNGNTFILGRRYLALERYFHKEIARVQAQWYGQTDFFCVPGLFLSGYSGYPLPQHR